MVKILKRIVWVSVTPSNFSSKKFHLESLTVIGNVPESRILIGITLGTFFRTQKFAKFLIFLPLYLMKYMCKYSFLTHVQSKLTYDHRSDVLHESSTVGSRYGMGDVQDFVEYQVYVVRIRVRIKEIIF